MSNNPYSKAIEKLNEEIKAKKRPKLEQRTFTLSRRAYKSICRAAHTHKMPPSVYLEILSMQPEIMEAMYDERG